MLTGYILVMAILGFVIATTDVGNELLEFSTLEKVALVSFWPVSLFISFLIASKKLRNKLTDKEDKLLDK